MIYRWLTAVAGCFLMISGVWAQPNTLSKIRDNGPEWNRFDIVVLGDGYTRAERDKYETDVAQLVDELFEESPFSDYESYFNVHRVYVASNQSGADDSNRNLSRDTALHAEYNCHNIERLLCVDENAVWDALEGLPLIARGIVIVLVNDTHYGGSGSAAMSVTSTNDWGAAVLLHEIGHSLGLLADEYYPAPGCSSEVEPSEKNVTRHLPVPPNKWSHWIADGTPVPASGGSSAVVSAYEGAKYCDKGLYRPTFNSRMKSINEPFGRVNTEELIVGIYNRVSLIESAEPGRGELQSTECGVLSFSVRTPGRRDELPDTLNTTWRIDNRVDDTTENSLQVDTCSLSVGRHRIEVTVRDMTTAVRSEMLEDSRQWTISVSR